MHAYLNTLLFLHSAFMLCMVKMLLKGEVGGCALNSHGNYIVDHGKSWKNHGIMFFEFLWEPCLLHYILTFAGSVEETWSVWDRFPGSPWQMSGGPERRRKTHGWGKAISIYTLKEQLWCGGYTTILVKQGSKIWSPTSPLCQMRL